MKSVSLASDRHLSTASKPALFDGLAQRGLLRQLEKLQSGSLLMLMDGQKHYFGEDIDTTSLQSSIEVLDPAFFAAVAFGGSIGAAESYMQGHWRSNDLVSLVQLLLRNRSVLEGMEGGAARLSAPIQKLFHWINRNSREGAKRNISAHYDLGNEFFSLWLDETMMYSSAIFSDTNMSLYEAQVARLDHICNKLDLRPEDHLLEIGTGWGGLAIYAAEQIGCRVTTTTISEQQFDLAEKRVLEAGLEGQVTVLRQDFRDLEGQYDKLVSIEMIEAIDENLYVPYFRKCAELLKPDGMMLIQAITMADQRYDEYRKSIDFIQRYIFPGSRLPSSAVMSHTVATETDMRLLNLEDIGLHYATTLSHWRQNFFNKIEKVRELGYPETFIRMWEFYLCYCEAAFLERAISDVQMVFARPENRATLV